MYMKNLKLLIGAMLLACACNCTGGEKPQEKEETVSTVPEALAVSAEKGTVTFSVTASGPFQVYSNDSWVLSVDPSYSADPTGTVTVRYDENISQDAREGSVVVKCGSLRHSVPVTQAGMTQNPDILVPDGYQLVWHDEFDGTTVSAKNWKFENWAPGRVNNELQRYVAGGELEGDKTAFVESGVLNIRAMKHGNQVISARMNSTESWTYGYMEARIWLPKGKGTWPAFWMMPDDQSLGWPNCGEIDIMEEVGCDPEQTSSSIHCESYNHVKGTQKTASRLTTGAESGFHVYAIEWTADGIVSYVDGKPLLSFPNDKKGNNATWPFNKSFFIILNLAWGGDWGGYKGVDESALPCTMKVDYVRVFQKK